MFLDNPCMCAGVISSGLFSHVMASPALTATGPQAPGVPPLEHALIELRHLHDVVADLGPRHRVGKCRFPIASIACSPRRLNGGRFGPVLIVSKQSSFPVAPTRSAGARSFVSKMSP